MAKDLVALRERADMLEAAYHKARQEADKAHIAWLEAITVYLTEAAEARRNG